MIIGILSFVLFVSFFYNICYAITMLKHEETIRGLKNAIKMRDDRIEELLNEIEFENNGK